MPYGPIDSRELFTPEYQTGAYVLDSNGEMGLVLTITGEMNDNTFPAEADAAFQAFMDLLNDSPLFEVSVGYKSWKSNKTVTPTE